MASVDKLILKMKNQPNGISIEEATKVLEAKGYHLARQNSSHCAFKNDAGDIFTVVKRKPTIKKVYVVEILDRIGEAK
jgi:predicted RNA binding protein YcfA (HicA-like mRNA interferase family)